MWLSGDQTCNTVARQGAEAGYMALPLNDVHKAFPNKN